MNSVIMDPLQEYETKFRLLHLENTTSFFEELVKRSGVSIEENRATVKQYHRYKEDLKKLKRKRNWLRFFRVLMCITLLLIPLVIWRMTPRIRALKEEIDRADEKAQDFFLLAQRQMAPLNGLFTSRDALSIMEQTVPRLSFSPAFTASQEEDMRINYDFVPSGDREKSALDVLSGSYNENPFLFENQLIHTMGMETYHGYKTISWTESYRDSSGKRRTRTRTETLHATVTKPKPFYSTRVVLHYGSQGAPELSFTRDATHLDQKSERALRRYVKRGEKRLKRKEEKALETNDDFTGMANSEFEVLFDALDRTDEVQFRTLFTPLAQINMVKLLLSKSTFGDDFHFIKEKRMNCIISRHSQGRSILLFPREYTSFSYDEIRENFLGKNGAFFKAVYFDFAPVLAIPAYGERPVHSLKPIPALSRNYSQKECEALANLVDRTLLVHPQTKTDAIVKSTFLKSESGADRIETCAYSYDTESRVDYVSVWGGDGRCHSVAVPWEEYLPLEEKREFSVAPLSLAQGKNALAKRGNIGIFPRNEI